MSMTAVGLAGLLLEVLQTSLFSSGVSRIRHLHMHAQHRFSGNRHPPWDQKKNQGRFATLFFFLLLRPLRGLRLNMLAGRCAACWQLEREGCSAASRPSAMYASLRLMFRKKGRKEETLRTEKRKKERKVK